MTSVGSGLESPTEDCLHIPRSQTNEYLVSGVYVCWGWGVVEVKEGKVEEERKQRHIL